ncbi:MAG: hypothetical protein J3K34DRAFT_422863 [Monoraphidium minutum]|nr:MAG: hypothetical protein J3K34DRAFT_422863 [Monoraphidium minutum]
MREYGMPHRAAGARVRARRCAARAPALLAQAGRRAARAGARSVYPLDAPPCIAHVKHADSAARERCYSDPFTKTRQSQGCACIRCCLRARRPPDALQNAVYHSPGPCLARPPLLGGLGSHNTPIDQQLRNRRTARILVGAGSGASAGGEGSQGAAGS